MERLKKPRQRKREGLVLAEGHRVVVELLRSSLTVQGLWIEDSAREAPLGPSVLSEARRRGLDVTVVEDGELKAVSDTESPQRVVAIAEEPPPAVLEGGGSARVLLLDALQDPGNLGTLIRSAWALGLTQVWTTTGCVDPWGTKAIRASAGAVFHTEIVRLDAGGEWVADVSLPVWVADAGGRPVTPDLGIAEDGWVLAVGNEGAGVSDVVREVGQGVAIPMAEGADSLNAAVAGSILMYVLVQAGR